MGINLEKIFTDIALLFENNSENIIKNPIINLKINLFNLRENIYTNIVLAKKKDLESLKKAYQIIMKARELFTGETISYRIYYSTSNNNIHSNNSVKIYDLTEEDLFNIIYQEGTALRLKSSFKNALQNANYNSQRETIFELHWQNISNGLTKQLKNNYTGYRVHKKIFNEFVGMNPGLINKKHPNSFQIFNQGHIYEAFEATADDLYGETDFFATNSKNSNILSEWFRQKYFGKYLAMDRVEGFKGGDVGLNQIKARKAQLMEATTLVKYLDSIIEILNCINYPNKKAFISKIKSEFLDYQHKEVNSYMDLIIENSFDFLISKMY